MKKLVARILVGAVAVIATGCSEHEVTLPHAARAPKAPAFGASVPFNSAGQCLGDDAVTWNSFVQGQPHAPTDLSCASSDLIVEQAIATHAVVNGIPKPLSSNTPLSCVERQPITLRMVARLRQLSPAPRYDIGLWTSLGPTALSGTCNHYNVPVSPLTAGASNLDADQCGDAGPAASVDVELGDMVFTCQTGLTLSTCLAWSSEADQGACPEPSVAAANGFRVGTLPALLSKCNCQPVEIQIGIPDVGSLTIATNTDPDDPQDFSFTTSSAAVPAFSLDDDADGTLPSRRTFSALDVGAYTITESGVPGFDLTSITCSTSAKVNVSTRTVTVAVKANTNVTCTFTNTKRATIRLNSVKTQGSPFRARAFQLRATASTASAGTQVAAGSASTLLGSVVLSCATGVAGAGVPTGVPDPVIDRGRADVHDQGGR